MLWCYVPGLFSGYAGHWSRYQGISREALLQDGDIIYGFRLAASDTVTFLLDVQWHYTGHPLMLQRTFGRLRRACCGLHIHGSNQAQHAMAFSQESKQLIAVPADNCSASQHRSSPGAAAAHSQQAHQPAASVLVADVRIGDSVHSLLSLLPLLLM